MMNSYSQNSFKNINNWIKVRLEKPGVPRFVQKIYLKIEMFVCWTVKYGSQKKEE